MKINGNFKATFGSFENIGLNSLLVHYLGSEPKHVEIKESLFINFKWALAQTLSLWHIVIKEQA